VTALTPDPVALAVFVLAAFAIAGVCQTLWLASWAMPSLARPIDGGLTWRGRRLLGDHKTWRGLVVMIPAAAISFAALHAAAAGAGLAGGLWTGDTTHYGWLGLAAGAGFMAGELPNSFLKRRIGIAPGRHADAGVARWVFRVLDHLDSVAGALTALAIVTEVPPATWALLAVGGPIVHAVFSRITARAGGKHRAEPDRGRRSPAAMEGVR
jgi:CDP-2,3-bis-(O-geranylgeranyl)-sn-glycerol synthase